MAQRFKVPASMDIHTNMEPGGVGARLLSQHPENRSRGSLGVQGQPDLHSKFQTSQRYMASEALSQTKEGEGGREGKKKKAKEEKYSQTILDKKLVTLEWLK